MDFFLSRYRNLTVLLAVIAAQLVLIAYQVKSNNSVPLIRVWAVTAVTPVEQGLEVVRRYTWGFVEDYFVLLGVRSANEKLRQENGQLKIENAYLKSQLGTADRAKALSLFQAQSPSKTVAARVIGNGTGANSKVVFVDRGSTSGVESGMAVVTPDGIVGKVVDAYPTASLVMLITDPTFGAGVVSQRNRVRGTLRGQGHAECIVDFVQNEERVDLGEWFYTSGDDRIFPRGFPVGQATAVRNGKTFKEIYVAPSALQGGIEEVLIVINGVHQEIPDSQAASPGYKILTPPHSAITQAPQETVQPSSLTTDADRLREIYKEAGDAQHHVYGEGVPGSKPPDFTKIPGLRGGEPPPQARAAVPGNTGAAPSSPGGPTAAGTTKPALPTGAGPGSQPRAKAQTDKAAAPKPSARPSSPILVTDPTDADPASDVTPAPAAKPGKPANSPAPPPSNP